MTKGDNRMGVHDNLRFNAAGRPRRAFGFTLPEFMIAMAIGLGVLAAAGSAYLFISKN